MKKLLPKMRNNPQGFTLVELLIAIVIIAILTVIAVAVYTGAQKNARDARRKEDIDAVSKAMEAYFTRTGAGAAPAYPTATADINSAFATGILPQDPNGVAYFTSGNSATVYKYCAKLENAKGGNTADNNNAPGAALVDGPWYCRTNQQ